MAACRVCAAPVLWLSNIATGAVGPIDAEPSPEGNVLVMGSNYALVAEARLAEVRAAGKALHRSHFLTCAKTRWRSA